MEILNTLSSDRSGLLRAEQRAKANNESWKDFLLPWLPHPTLSAILLCSHKMGENTEIWAALFFFVFFLSNMMKCFVNTSFHVQVMALGTIRVSHTWNRFSLLHSSDTKHHRRQCSSSLFSLQTHVFDYIYRAFPPRPRPQAPPSVSNAHATVTPCRGVDVPAWIVGCPKTENKVQSRHRKRFFGSGRGRREMHRWGTEAVVSG